eukprot:TRINITY_DN49276_c0_g1_i2.p1 TRINITY_DN49276_c0_g1~~TRINITY_DN49276_c0_g1_i2.p1  ORF type:complete len:384 (-),score=46.73 TRINITY_DN49276_c0_g1_i2:32-1183(-)
MMEGRPTRPDVMVTHNWSNLFRDLISAILADALDDTCFDFIAYLLDHDRICDIEVLLTPAHLKRTYWVCAFSVNQHISICHANPFRTRDSVTLELHSTCTCSAQKYDNATPPLRRRDSKSIRCQMNKFDDMIALLSSDNSSFRQVVAVDIDFALFSRAWCVAELAMAYKMGMPQALKFVSTNALQQVASARLQNLRIQDMQAARKEDVQEILSKIPDVDAFNAKLHELLFSRNGLLAQMVGFDVEAMIRRLSITMTLHMAAIELIREKPLKPESLSVECVSQGVPTEGKLKATTDAGLDSNALDDFMHSGSLPYKGGEETDKLTRDGSHSASPASHVSHAEVTLEIFPEARQSSPIKLARSRDLQQLAEDPSSPGGSFMLFEL